jgi:hypothetical protein
MGIDYYGGGDEYPLGMEPIPEEGEELYHPADEDHRQYDQLQAEEPLLGDVLRQQRHQQQQRRGGLGVCSFLRSNN